MSKDRLAVITSRRRALILNTLIVIAYVGIAFVADPFLPCLAGFLLLAVLIRCATLFWMTWAANQGSSPTALLLVAFNLVRGILFSAALVTVLWWLGRLWPGGVEWLVAVIAAAVTYKSTFPVPPRGN